jgi:hypothetical protein
MPLSKTKFAEYIRAFQFRELFNDLGWNSDKGSQPIIVDTETFILQSVAVKSGFKILICAPDKTGQIPDYNIRKKIETKITKLFQEHLIIFIDAREKEQVWQLVMKQTGKPAKVTDTRYALHQDPELLYQRVSGLFFELDEEENITIVDVTERVAANFHQNAERVTKQFYERFKKEHLSFYAFIKGIDDHIDEWNKKRKKEDVNQENKAKQWYVSLMLNRLMFCYFIQKKGFLDKNKNYLREKLKDCKQKKGKDKFYSFYRNFLLVLFHEGLNEPERRKIIKDEIGIIPYLNGGLFDEHELEKEHKEIEIDDKAFERIFDFFDEYEWHLDTRQHSTGRDINPDVIGYIFEKYINDRAQMGAYYTKEDITDYISKNCIIPWLFDETARQYPKAFAATGEVWNELKDSSDTYIYPAVKFGMAEALPKNISVGIKDVDKRKDWNKAAPESIALPTEIWREVVERRKRYEEVTGKISSGAISNINDFITYNLNIREFAQDVIANTNDPELLKCFYKSLTKVTIIDPTCGSGAFLFAAMNILEPLYYACIIRMRGFTEDEDRANEQQPKKFSNKYKFFREVLEKVQSEHHPNTEYFIYKSIILNNLYGVDIMREAVEIAKLRLFLKLVATVDADYKKPNLGLEPLPDIDFNIRSGNTLIGFATEEDLKKGLRYTLDGVAAAPVIEEKCDIVAKAFARYKEIQLSYGDDFKEFKKAKAELSKRLKELNKELNKLLHKQAEGLKYDEWLETHQPFHWFAEFYEIIHDRSGFDIIIGNPPYVEYSSVRSTYTVNGYDTIKCNNLFALCTERSYCILSKIGYIGLIIQLSSTTTISMQPLQKYLVQKSDTLYASFFPERPQHLFDGAHIGLTILIATKSKNEITKLFTSSIIRTYKENRLNIFMTLAYCQNRLFNKSVYFLKSGKEIEHSILTKLLTNSAISNTVSPTPNKNYLSYRTAGGMYWRTAICRPFRTTSTSNKTSFIGKDYSNYLVAALINSTTFWFYYASFYDLFNFKDYMIFAFPFSYNSADKNILNKLEVLGKDLMANYDKNVVVNEKFMKGKNQTAYFESFNSRLAKNILDKIDFVLAEHYKFSKEEVEYITNYDVKYRFAKDTEET